MSSKQDILCSRLYAFYENHKYKGKTFIWQHFKAEGAKKATIYRLMRRIDAGETLIRKKGTGKKPIYDTPKKRAQVSRKFNHSRSVSLRKQAKNTNAAIQQLQICLKKDKSPYDVIKEQKDRIEHQSNAW
jgi:hypothetical protein